MAHLSKPEFDSRFYIKLGLKIVFFLCTFHMYLFCFQKRVLGKL